jgi:anti-anti-sigma factor
VTRTGPVTSITLFGELDLSNRDAIGEVFIAEVNRPGTTTVCIDLSRVSFLGSAGVQALLIGYRAAEVLGRRYTVVGANGAPLRVLKLTGVLALFDDAPGGGAATPRSTHSEVS